MQIQSIANVAVSEQISRDPCYSKAISKFDPFIVGLWTGEAHLDAAVVNNCCSARIRANASSVMSSKLPGNVSPCSHIYCRTDDVDFVILNHSPFQKVRTSQSKTFLSYFYSQWCWPTLSLQAHTCVQVENYHQARAIFTDLFLSFSFHWFGVGFFFHLKGKFISCAYQPASLRWFWKPSSHPPFCWVHFSMY